MAISSVSGSPPPPVAQQTVRTQPKQDNDGDNDGSRAGEVESQEANNSVTAGSTIGGIINTTA